MKFTQHSPEGANVIRRYGAEFIQIGDEEIRASCIVSAQALLRDWPPTTVEELTPAHLAPLFELAPELVVLATGSTQRFPRAALRAEFSQRKIGIEVMEVGAACRTFNVLISEERHVLAAFLIPRQR